MILSKWQIVQKQHEANVTGSSEIYLAYLCTGMEWRVRNNQRILNSWAVIIDRAHCQKILFLIQLAAAAALAWLEKLGIDATEPGEADKE